MGGRTSGMGTGSVGRARAKEMRMKRGDLVRVGTGNPWCTLSPDEGRISGRLEGKTDPDSFDFKDGEVGFVLEMGTEKNPMNQYNVRVLTPRGIGWGSKHWFKVIG
jgi:hypothetical protein